MARKVFFSFHYQVDIWRANQIRNAHIVEGTSAAGWQDASLWEEAKRLGDPAVHELINRGLEGTTVTAVLIGSQTASRKYVNYEIERSIQRGNGLLGIYIHDLKDQRGFGSPQGVNPFDQITWRSNGQKLSTTYRTYSWSLHDGYRNLGQWVEDAVRATGR
ncbi:MAG: TIR domain-containing protein [Nitrospira sp.]|nr:TIR domain-containing protein [Nitrospira sp.]MBX3336452.1 TIR domain-containing protein [Nitrospira sp.]MCW5778985.1 TIR domain-containing protein [Nitrospira sp.]HNL88163.1 TIR domain-containing protein [Nitrospira sp.]